MRDDEREKQDSIQGNHPDPIAKEEEPRQENVGREMDRHTDDSDTNHDTTI